MKKLKVQQFIEDHKDNWEELLSNAPYSLVISRDVFHHKNLLMLKYNQCESDFNNEIVRECRGLILDADTFEPVSVPFFKFGNIGESYCPEIDWNSAHCLEKVDGSLIKIVNIDNELFISTNGTIDAFKAPIAEQIGCSFKSFGDIVLHVLTEKLITAGDFLEGYTYMFELVSPYTRVVVQHEKPDLYYLGRRNNETFEEILPFNDLYVSKLFKMPKVFSLHSIDDCINAAKELPWDEEGYVVVDKFFNRVKVKSPSYCAVHHMKGNGTLSYERGIDIVRSNEISEVVTYFPEFKNHLDGLKEKLKQTLLFLNQAWTNYLIMDSKLLSRKDKAIEIQKLFKSFSGIGFALLDHKINSPKEWLETCPSNKLVKFLGYKD